MPVRFHILRNASLVYVHYQGFARVSETLTAFSEYARHPLCRPGQKQLVDLSGINGFERDYVKLFQLQAKKTEVFTGHHAQTLIVYYAPTPETLAMARLIERSWEPFPSVVARVQQSETDALALLGLREESFAELLLGAD